MTGEVHSCCSCKDKAFLFSRMSGYCRFLMTGSSYLNFTPELQKLQNMTDSSTNVCRHHFHLTTNFYCGFFWSFDFWWYSTLLEHIKSVQPSYGMMPKKDLRRLMTRRTRPDLKRTSWNLLVEYRNVESSHKLLATHGLIRNTLFYSKKKLYWVK